MTHRLHPAVASLTVFTGRHTLHGTAVVCRDASGRKAILTCAHLFPSTGLLTAKIMFPDCQPVPVELVAADRLFDLAVLTSAWWPLETADFIPLAATSPPIGAPITFSGYDPTDVYAIRRGTVLKHPAYPHLPDDKFLICTTTSIPTSLGGPILTSAGELAGILWGADETSVIGTGIGKIRKILEKTAIFTGEVVI